MAERVNYRERVDHKILFVLISLIAFGLVMVFSVTSSKGIMGTFVKQVTCMAVGLIILFVAKNFDVDLLRIFVVPTYVTSYIMIICLKILPATMKRTVNGATRWLYFGFQFQVAEFVKLGVILMLAYMAEQWIGRKRSSIEEIKYIILMWAIGGIPTVLLYVISDDLSSSIVILGVTFIMTFISCRGKTGWFFHILCALAVVVAAVMAVVYVSGHMPSELQYGTGAVSFRIFRVAAWLHPEKYVDTAGYQPMHCLYAIANGGWFGKGLGQSWQKGILPESHNDLIFAILIEELGIFGGLVLIFMFGVLITQMCKVIYRSKDYFGRLIVAGITAHIMLQVMIHCGVCTNLIPNTGIGLPFISTGMTASLFQLVEMTIVLMVAHEQIFDLKEKKKEKSREKIRKRVTGERGPAARSTARQRTSRPGSNNTSTNTRQRSTRPGNTNATSSTRQRSTRPGSATSNTIQRPSQAHPYKKASGQTHNVSNVRQFTSTQRKKVR